MPSPRGLRSNIGGRGGRVGGVGSGLLDRFELPEMDRLICLEGTKGGV